MRVATLVWVLTIAVYTRVTTDSLGTVGSLGYEQVLVQFHVCLARTRYLFVSIRIACTCSYIQHLQPLHVEHTAGASKAQRGWSSGCERTPNNFSFKLSSK